MISKGKYENKTYRKTGAAQLPSLLGKYEVTGSNPVISSMKPTCVMQVGFLLYCKGLRGVHGMAGTLCFYGVWDDLVAEISGLVSFFVSYEQKKKSLFPYDI